MLLHLLSMMVVGAYSLRQDAVVIAVMLDGSVLTLDALTGQVRGSFSSGESVVQSTALSEGNETIVVPMLDGRLIMGKNGQFTVLPSFAPDLVMEPQMSCLAVNEKDGPVQDESCVLLLGEKSVNIFRVNSNTGSGLKVGYHKPKSENLPALTNFEGNDLLLQRDDYVVRALDSESAQEIWNVTLAHFTALDLGTNKKPFRLKLDFEREFLDETGEEDLAEFPMKLYQESTWISAFEAKTNRFLWRKNIPFPAISFFGSHNKRWVPVPCFPVLPSLQYPYFSPDHFLPEPDESEQVSSAIVSIQKQKDMLKYENYFPATHLLATHGGPLHLPTKQVLKSGKWSDRFPHALGLASLRNGPLNQVAADISRPPELSTEPSNEFQSRFTSKLSRLKLMKRVDAINNQFQDVPKSRVPKNTFPTEFSLTDYEKFLEDKFKNNIKREGKLSAESSGVYMTWGTVSLLFSLVVLVVVFVGLAGVKYGARAHQKFQNALRRSSNLLGTPRSALKVSNDASKEENGNGNEARTSNNVIKVDIEKDEYFENQAKLSSLPTCPNHQENTIFEGPKIKRGEFFRRTESMPDLECLNSNSELNRSNCEDIERFNDSKLHRKTKSRSWEKSYLKERVPSNAGSRDIVSDAAKSSNSSPVKKAATDNNDQNRVHMLKLPSNRGQGQDIPLVNYQRYESDFIESEKLGKGGFGTVYLCSNRLDGGDYAIKKIRLSSDERFVSQLHKVLREVKIVAQLDHVNVVRYFQAWLEKISDDELLREQLDGSHHSQSGLSFVSYYKNLHSSHLSAKVNRSNHIYGSKMIRNHFNGSHKSNKFVNLTENEDSDGDMSNWSELTDDQPVIEERGEDGISFSSNGSTSTNASSRDSSDFRSKLYSRNLSRQNNFSAENSLNSIPGFRFDRSNDKESSRDRGECFSLKSSEARESSSVHDKNKCEKTCENEERNGFSKVHNEAPIVRDLWLYIQMQYCMNSTLQKFIEGQGGAIEIPKVMDIFRQIGTGLTYVHRTGLIHRDLKPANCFLFGDGTVKIGDFGLSRQVTKGLMESDEPFSLQNKSSPVRPTRRVSRVPLSPDASNTAGVGTYFYASPEQLSGRDYDEKTDIFSLGIMLFEMTIPCFSTAMERTIVLQDAQRSIFPPQWTVPSEHPQIYDLIRRMLSWAPCSRPSSSEVVRAVDTMQGRHLLLQLDPLGSGGKVPYSVLRIEANEREGLLHFLVELVKQLCSEINREDPLEGEIALNQYVLQGSNGTAVIELKLIGTDSLKTKVIVGKLCELEDVKSVREFPFCKSES